MVSRNLRVCVVGAGAAGLCAARNVLSRPELFGQLDVLEQAGQLGGTWVYTETVGYDSFGLPVHTSMYKSLRTNLPKEIMGFPDFPIPPRKESYLPAKDLLAFLQRYSDQHGVTPHIKFNHHVKLIKHKEDERWDVTYLNLVTGQETTKEYDYIMICNGHFNTPFIPTIEGMPTFKGDVVHSHDYRVPETYACKKILVVGAGKSGLDIALELTALSSRVILSHHLKEKPKTAFPENMVQRPDLMQVEGETVRFVDGSEEDVDVILFCTGYKYNFPFLHESCGITVDDNCVWPLYKHVVNIAHPSMCFVGIPSHVCAFSMFHLQVQYVIRYIDGSFQLPSREEMERDTLEEMKERERRGFQKRHTHMMGPDQADYYVRLSSESGAPAIPPVLPRIHNDSSRRFMDDLLNYRRDQYTVVDAHNFVKTTAECVN